MEMSKLKEIAQYTLSRLKEYGADDAQCKVKFGIVDEINVDCRVYRIRTSATENGGEIHRQMGGMQANIDGRGSQRRRGKLLL